MTRAELLDKAQHLHGARWLVKKGSAEHEDMKRVLATLSPRQKAP